MKKESIWVVVTGDSESARLTNKTTHRSREAAETDVLCWYDNSIDDKNCEGAQLDEDGLFACAYINGRYEFCEAFEAEF